MERDDAMTRKQKSRCYVTAHDVKLVLLSVAVLEHGIEAVVEHYHEIVQIF